MPHDSAMPGPQVAVLSFSRIVRDRRVLRQCALLEQMGHAPLIIAYGNDDETVPYAFCRWPVPQPTIWHRLKTVMLQTPAHLGLWAAKLGFWAEPRHRWALAMLRKARPHLVIANDWPALVVATAYKTETGASVHYDTHEFATLEFNEQRWWRLVYKPFVSQLERACIHKADTISTVGPHLAEALQEYYGLITKPGVVRSTPNAIIPPKIAASHWPLRILYHGYVLPNRGIEELISSTALWMTPHKLTIRGDGDSSYLALLRQLAEETGRGYLIDFENAVAPDDVVPIAAQTADVGVFFTSLDTIQRNFVMPNKLFEYIMAGLAIAISPAVDMKAIVEYHQIGVVSANASIKAIAEAINSLTQENVRFFRTRSREAAKILCWENECQQLAKVIGLLLESPGQVPAKPTAP